MAETPLAIGAILLLAATVQSATGFGYPGLVLPLPERGQTAVLPGLPVSVSELGVGVVGVVSGRGLPRR
jgi:hypothetical protein